MIRPLASVFPHALLYEQPGIRMLIGSNQPLTWDGEAMGSRLRSAFSTSYYARAGVDVEPYVRRFASATPTVLQASTRRAGPADLNTDLFPRDEFLVPRRQ